MHSGIDDLRLQVLVACHTNIVGTSKRIPIFCQHVVYIHQDDIRRVRIGMRLEARKISLQLPIMT